MKKLLFAGPFGTRVCFRTPFTSITRLARQASLALLLLAGSVAVTKATTFTNATLDPSRGTWTIDSDRDLLLNGVLYLREKRLNTAGTSVFITALPGVYGRNSACLTFKHIPDSSDPEDKQRTEYYAKQGLTGTIFYAARFCVGGDSTNVSTGYFSVISQFQQEGIEGKDYTNPFVDFDLTPDGTNFLLNVHYRNDDTYYRTPKNYVNARSYSLAFYTWHSILAEVRPDFTGGVNGYIKVSVDGGPYNQIYTGKLGYGPSVVPRQRTTFQQTFGLYRSNQNSGTLRIYYDNYTLANTYSEAIAAFNN